MTYHNAVKYIKNALPSSAGEHMSERVEYLCRLIDNPQKKIKYIRLAGTNGKTICSEMLASVLSLSGYNVCTLNMSELDDVRDNIKINCKQLDIPQFTHQIQTVASLCTLVRERVKQAKAELEASGSLSDALSDIPLALLDDDAPLFPTHSEILLLAMLCYCKSYKCDVCIIESANTDPDPSLLLPAPFAAVICGAIPSGDKRQISRIKHYIQRGISEVVSAPQDPVAYKTISDTCAAINCRLSVPVRSALSLKQLSLIGSRFVYGNEEYRLSLCGRFQTTNAITAIEALKLLRRSGYNIPIEAEKNGLMQVRIPSRFEVLSVSPTIITDSTYQNEAVETVCESLFDFSEITGRSLSLCLPKDPDLLRRYLGALEARGYTVDEVFTLCDNEDEIKSLSSVLSDSQTITACPTVKALSKELIAKRSSYALLLVSGNSRFTSPIRLEIMRYLQF